MGMTRGTALVLTVARVVQLTMVQDLNNLESDNELTLTEALVAASDVVYDRLEADGNDPTLLSNQLVFEQAVAWEFLTILAAGGWLRADGETPTDTELRYRGVADRRYEQVRPKTSEADMARRANEAIPSVGNFEPGWHFAGGSPNRQDEYSERLPGSKP